MLNAESLSRSNYERHIGALAETECVENTRAENKRDRARQTEPRPATTSTVRITSETQDCSIENDADPDTGCTYNGRSRHVGKIFTRDGTPTDGTVLQGSTCTKDRRIENNSVAQDRILASKTVTKDRNLESNTITKFRNVENNAITKYRTIQSKNITKDELLAENTVEKDRTLVSHAVTDDGIRVGKTVAKERGRVNRALVSRAPPDSRTCLSGTGALGALGESSRDRNFSSNMDSVLRLRSFSAYSEDNSRRTSADKKGAHTYSLTQSISQASVQKPTRNKSKTTPLSIGESSQSAERKKPEGITDTKWAREKQPVSLFKKNQRFGYTEEVKDYIETSPHFYDPVRMLPHLREQSVTAQGAGRTRRASVAASFGANRTRRASVAASYGTSYARGTGLAVGYEESVRLNVASLGEQVAVRDVKTVQRASSGIDRPTPGGVGGVGASGITLINSRSNSQTSAAGAVVHRKLSSPGSAISQILSSAKRKSPRNVHDSDDLSNLGNVQVTTSPLQGSEPNKFDNIIVNLVPLPRCRDGPRNKDGRRCRQSCAVKVRSVSHTQETTHDAGLDVLTTARESHAWDRHLAFRTARVPTLRKSPAVIEWPITNVRPRPQSAPKTAENSGKLSRNLSEPKVDSGKANRFASGAANLQKLAPEVRVKANERSEVKEVKFKDEESPTASAQRVLWDSEDSVHRGSLRMDQHGLGSFRFYQWAPYRHRQAKEIDCWIKYASFGNTQAHLKNKAPSKILKQYFGV